MKEFEGSYIRLSDFPGADQQAPRVLEALANPQCGWFYSKNADMFYELPGNPIAYWLSNKAQICFQKGIPLGDYAAPRKGNSTSNNDRFLRRWYEVSRSHTNIGASNIKKEETILRRWYPYNKGGDYRRWYGNNDYLIDWFDNGAAIRSIPTAVVTNEKYYMKPGLTWSTVSSAKFNIRKFGNGYIFDNGGCCVFELGENTNYILGLMNSEIFNTLCGSLNPTLNFQSGDVSKFPVIIAECDASNLVEENVALAKKDWDSLETSWDYLRHPLI